jgi:hypothetical protein
VTYHITQGMLPWSRCLISSTNVPEEQMLTDAEALKINFAEICPQCFERWYRVWRPEFKRTDRPRFFLKYRSFEAAAHNPYRPHGQVKFDPWKSREEFATIKEALAALHRQQGLYDWAVFYQGKRISKNKSPQTELAQVLMKVDDIERAFFAWARPKKEAAA